MLTVLGADQDYQHHHSIVDIKIKKSLKINRRKQR